MRTFVCCLLLGAANVALADVCDYTPSNLVGGKATAATAGVTGATAATGIGLKLAGFYSLFNATTGAAMLGSTAAGASAAGTAGILGGTAGVLGTMGAVAMSPFVIIPAAVTAGAIAVYEGGCYLADGKNESGEEQQAKDGK